MAIKRKTINIKKVKLIKPTYTKPTPKKIVSFFTEPVHIPVEEIKVKKKRSNLQSQKVKKAKKAKKAKQAKPVHKGPLILTKKSIQKLKPKEKQKKKRSRKKPSKIARPNFPLGTKSVKTPIVTQADDIDFSDEYIDWPSTKQSAIDRLYSALHSMAEENPDSSSKELAHMGADYAGNYLKDTFIEYDEDTLAEFLLSYPLSDFFDSYVLFYGGLGLVTGDTSQLYKLEDPLYRYADNLSYSYKKDLANSDRVDDI
jgi:hypothetical protein